jgi:diguanylate cyclase (GGDEF)-like protein/PAS domain S-box-containing protein
VAATGDPRRLAALGTTRLLDSPSEEAFDRLTRLAQRLTGAPVALVTLVDLDRQFFKSAIGVDEPWASERGTPLSHSFCQHVVTSGKPMVVSDAREVPALADNLAIADLSAIAYAGIPLTAPNGEHLGALCAIDTEPREWSADDIAVLEDLAAIGNAEIERRLAAQSPASDSSLDATVTSDVRGRVLEWNRAAEEMFGYSRDEAIGRETADLIVPARLREAHRRGLARFADPDTTGRRLEVPAMRADGSEMPVELSVARTDAGREPLITAYIRDMSDVRRAQAALLDRERQLTHLAFHDQLTGLPNRARLETDLDQALERAHRTGRGLGVLYLDLDNFKHVNDTLGHATGDELLCAVADRLTASARRTDLVARLGGDEFIVVADLTDDAETSARELAQKLIDSLRQPFATAGYELVTGTSVGIALFPDDGRTPAELIKHADVAMYEAKNEGRGTFAFHRPGARTDSDLLAVTTRLRRALGEGELVLHYQPIFELVTRSPVSVEALVRWNHPDRGLVMPGEFVPAAERSGLIDAIGAWVTSQACTQARQWQDAGLDIPVAVNVSPRELRRDHVAERLAACIASAGIEPRLLTVEVTEAAAMSGRGGSLEVLDEITTTGVRIAIDDFGAGYSSLARLRAMPADILKIDGSFLRDVPDDPVACHIITAIIRLARALGVETVAEGIETEEQLEFVFERGCVFGQGYHLARPLTADAATELFSRARAAVV